MSLKWDSSLNTGIDEIDNQHRKIVDYINELEVAMEANDPDGVKAAIDNVIDYTQSHFAYEENLMREAEYKFLATHAQIHALFVRNAATIAERFTAGENVAAELHGMLSKWLFTHIRNDDGHYVRAVSENMKKAAGGTKGQGWLASLFGRRKAA